MELGENKQLGYKQAVPTALIPTHALLQKGSSKTPERSNTEMIITRRGQRIGYLELGDRDEWSSPLPGRDGDEGGLSIVSEIDGELVAGIIFRWTGKSIELADPIRWSSESGDESEPLIRRSFSEAPPLWEVSGEVYASPSGNLTKFLFETRPYRYNNRFRLRLEISDESEDGFISCYFRGDRLDLSGAIRGEVWSSLQHGDGGGDFSFYIEGAGSLDEGRFVGRMISESQAARGASEFRFDFDFRGPGVGSGSGRFRGSDSSDFPLFWLLQQTFRRIAASEGSAFLQIRVGLLGFTSDDMRTLTDDMRTLTLDEDRDKDRLIPPWSRRTQEPRMIPHELEELEELEEELGEDSHPLWGRSLREPLMSAPEPTSAPGLLSASRWLLKLLVPFKRVLPRKIPYPAELSRRALLDHLASGKFPKEEVAQRPYTDMAEAEPHPVDCTVFAPDRVERKSKGLLQVFIHAPEDREHATADAQKYDREAKERGHRSLVMDAPIGTVFAFEAEIEGFDIKERRDELLWTGQPQATTFRFEVPRACKWGQHVGTV